MEKYLYLQKKVWMTDKATICLFYESDTVVRHL